MRKMMRRMVGGVFVGALAAGALVGAAGVAQAQPANCMTIPMGVAGTSFCWGPGEHRIVLDCVDRFFPVLFGSSHGYTTMVVEGPWMRAGELSFATCLGEGGMLPITGMVRTEVR